MKVGREHLHPGNQALAHIRLAETEREVGHFLLVAFQTEDLAHRDHVEVEEILTHVLFQIFEQNYFLAPAAVCLFLRWADWSTALVLA